MLTKPRILLHLEGVALFGLSLYFYHVHQAVWSRFLLLFLAPDLGMPGYVANTRTGAATYNLCHTEALPIAMVAVALAGNHPQLIPLALIWLAHIGFDRALGYGLKYPAFFKDTHLQRLS